MRSTHLQQHQSGLFDEQALSNLLDKDCNALNMTMNSRNLKTVESDEPIKKHGYKAMDCSG